MQLTEEAKQYLPPAFSELLDRLEPKEWGHVIVEVESVDRLEAVSEDVVRMGYRTKEPIIAPGLIAFPAHIPLDHINDIAELEWVEKVYYDAPKYGQDIKVGKPPILPPPTMYDPIYGRIGYKSDVEIDGIPLSGFWMYLSAVMGLPSGPALALHTGLSSFLRDIKLPMLKLPMSDTIIPTSEARKIVNAPDDKTVENTRVAVLDTGAIVEAHPLWKKAQNKISYTGEEVSDLIGHGSWVQTTAFGSEYTTMQGLCTPVADVTGDNVFIAKVLSNTGFGMTEFILRAMAWCAEHDVKVVNMSLGGPFDNSIEDNPENQIIEATQDDMIFCVAAGNSGPDYNTIGSPAISPHALSVGSVNMRGEVSGFSSRGPSSGWYAEHQDYWKRDTDRYGEDMIKPDVCAPGGDAGELIHSAVQGWMDGEHDILLDGLGSMKGTSMATPIVAGLVAILLEEGKIRTAADVKRVMREVWGKDKSVNVGYGIMDYEAF